MRDGRRRIAAAADPAARALGLNAGIAIAHARALVAGLDIREADFAGDAAALERLAHWAMRRFTPLVAVDPPDGLWLDVTGASHLHGGEAVLLDRLVARLAASGVTARAAVAATPGCAHAVARYGDARIATVAANDTALAAALDPLPVAALRLDAAATDVLRRLGIASIGALRRLPRAPLTRRLDRGVVARLDAALGTTAEAIDWLACPVVLGADCKLLEPVVTAAALQQVIARLCAELCAAAAERGSGIRIADLRFARVDGDVVALRAGTSRPTRDAAHLAKLFDARIETVDPGFGIEAASLTAPLTEPLPPEQLGDELSCAPDLAALVDRLASRLGRRRVYRVAPRDSDLPERSTARVAAIGADLAAWPAYPRPVRLFDPPEYVAVTAVLPDHPPVRFRWRGMWHRVAAADGPERVFGEWWLADAERSSVRDYFAIEDDGGARFWLFRAGDGVDPTTGSMDWYLQGLW